MKKITFIASLLCLIMNIGLVSAQKSLLASTAQGTASTSADLTWQDVAQTSLTLTAGAKVLVEATIEVEVVNGNSNLLSQFKLIEVGTTNESKTISRYVATKDYTDKGIVAISFIFNSTAGAKTFMLQHYKATPGANKSFSSKAVITAIEIESSAITLPNIQAITSAPIATSSSSYSPVATTGKITLEKIADIYIVSTFSTSTTSAPSTGQWSLRESTLATSGFTEIPNSQITRTVTSTDGIGAATIVTLIKNHPAGDHYFRLSHQLNSGTNITTSGATISAVVLRGTTATGGNVFPSYSSLNGTGTNPGSTYSDLATATITAPTNGYTTNKFFMHTSFNMSAATANVVYATYKFGSPGLTPLALPLFELQRYVLNGTTGSGGLIGIVSGINEGTTFNASFQHKNSGGTGTLTSSNVNSIGFFLNSDPSLTLSVEEDLLNASIQIYPNPAREQFYLKNNVTEGETSFQLYTLTGLLMRTISLKPKTNTTLDISGWSPGIYILKATNNDITTAKKLIIQ